MRLQEDQEQDLGSLLVRLLNAQAEPTLVDQLAQYQEEDPTREGGVYEASITALNSLGPGKQLAFRVDLDECTGCKACVTACHNLNGLAPAETWRDVGSVVAMGQQTSDHQTVTTACHHCEEPACLKGCPVQAYEKDAHTGIVKHLDDQCIGCSYCIWKCPYDVPKFNDTMGIVRKCDMCTGRLSAGEAPACVQGCPNEAISIQVVSVGEARSVKPLLPGSHIGIPSSDYTRPTTQYVSKRAWPAVQPADRSKIAPSEAHDPLALMLVLTQMSLGGMFYGGLVVGSSSSLVIYHLLWSGLSGGLGLLGATLHLGRPMYAFRAFLGWRTSWLSREIILLGGYVPLIWMTLGLYLLGYGSGVGHILYAFTGLLGLLAGWSSAMIYVDTQRPVWALFHTLGRFAGTAFGLGAIVHGAGRIGLLNDLWGMFFIGLGVVILGIKLRGEMRLKRLFSTKSSPQDSVQEALARTAYLLQGPLAGQFRLRIMLGAGGLAFSLLAGIATVVWGTFVGLSLFGVAGGALLAGEFMERHLYFTSEASFRMPGC